MPDAPVGTTAFVATTEGRSRSPGHDTSSLTDRPESAIANFRSIIPARSGCRSAAAADLARSDLLRHFRPDVARFRPHIPVRQFNQARAKASLNACGSLRKRRESSRTQDQSAASGRSPASSVSFLRRIKRIRNNFRCVYRFEWIAPAGLRVCTHSYLNRFSKNSCSTGSASGSRLLPDQR